MKIELLRSRLPATTSHQPPTPFILATATAADREIIYRARHEVYADLFWALLNSKDFAFNH